VVFGYGDVYVNASTCLLAFSGNMVLAGKWRCYDIPAMRGRGWSGLGYLMIRGLWKWLGTVRDTVHVREGVLALWNHGC